MTRNADVFNSMERIRRPEDLSITERVRFLMLVCGSAAMLATIGCTLPSRAAPRSNWGAVSTQLSKEELAELLAQFADTFDAAVRDAADRIVMQQPDRRTRRLALLLQTRLPPMMRDAIDQEDALSSLLDVWVLGRRISSFFTDGDGRTMFEQSQTLIVDATQRSLEQIEEIAARILTSEALERARGAVTELAQRFPLRGEFSGATVRTAVQKPEHEPGILNAILTMPLAPFRAFDGIDRGAAAIRGFTAVAARMNETIHELPERARLQTQLLLLEIEDLESIRSALASVDELAQSSSRISTAAEQLPQALRRELTAAADDLESRQAQLQRTLQEAQQTAARVNEALGRVESAASAVERTAVNTSAAGDAWTRTFHAITEMVESFRAPGAPPPASAPRQAATSAAALPKAEHVLASNESASPKPTNRDGFDINEYTLAAQAIDRAALQLQELTREIRVVSGSRELAESLGNVEGRARGVVELSRVRAAEIVDHIAWRAAQLIALIFASSVAYRVLARFVTTRAVAGGRETK